MNVCPELVKPIWLNRQWGELAGSANMPEARAVIKQTQFSFGDGH